MVFYQYAKKNPTKLRWNSSKNFELLREVTGHMNKWDYFFLFSSLHILKYLKTSINHAGFNNVHFAMDFVETLKVWCKLVA